MEFFLCFIPLFIAIDVVGLLPVYMGLTEGMDKERRRAVVRVACITAVTVAVTFVFLGEGIFKVLGITTDDFRVAGGLLLLIFAIQDLTIGGKPRRSPSDTDTVAVVPLGMPLLVGPGVLTTSLLLVHQYGYLPTLGALLANLVIVFAVLSLAEHIIRIVTPSVAAAAAKVASLLLGAIGVMMLRVGILGTIKAFKAP
jgi:multiple antibiotic resistance protein